MSNNMFSKFEVATFKHEMAEFQKTMDKKGKDLLKQGFKEFFEKYPYVGTISWTQYTIYFNDGDVCPFNINDFQLHIRGQEGEDFLQDKGDAIDMYGLSEKEYPYLTQECFDDLAILEEGCREIESTLESIFGDHVEVVATREGFEVEAYTDHD